MAPTPIEPVPTPVSKAARMPPNAAPRRAGSTNFITWLTKAGYWLPKPRPNTAAATTSSLRVRASAVSASPTVTSPRHGSRKRRWPTRSARRPEKRRVTSTVSANAVKKMLRGAIPSSSERTATKLVMPP